MNEQPAELREYMIEAEALVKEWYSRDGVEGSHRANLEMVATLLVLNVIIGSERSFGELRAAAMVYLTAAFQMGRACDNSHSDSVRPAL